jgi:hypothetical protein
MSGLTKKVIYADKTLSTLLSVKEGALVSYSELSKGLHRYIKEKDLKNPKSVHLQAQTPIEPAPTEPAPTETVTEQAATCRDCGEAIPTGAVYCDMCGMRQ